MKLVIAEKPSVAQSLARVIGANKRQEGYLEGNGYLVSWCVGHLVELSAPERYDERFAKWRLEDLPILPERFLYEVSAGTSKQYQILKGLMERPEYDALYEAALCRERADWIVGMNATRLFSCLYGQTLAVGRVMTPTLAMVVMRDAQIAAFKPEPFWTVQITAGGITATSPRFQQKEAADSLATLCREEGQAMIRNVETKEKLEKPPLLYDLTSLQRDANRILGFTAQQTLDYTQSLYELVTYPRTDSRYLTDDMREMLPALIASVSDKFG